MAFVVDNHSLFSLKLCSMKKYLPFLTSLIIFGCQSEEGVKEMPPQDIPVVEVIQKDVPIYVEQVGQIFGLKDIPIRARVDGFLEEIAFQEGMAVKKGQLLYRIDDNPFQESLAAFESKVSEAQTHLTNAKNELDRYVPLAEINAVSKSDLDAAQANYDAAKAALKAAEANYRASAINLSYCLVKSPIDGVIGKTEARIGEYVGKEPNPVILNTVSRIDTVRVQFSISERMYLTLARELKNARIHAEKHGEKKELEKRQNVELILSDNTLYEEPGSIDFINRQIDATTGSIMIQASFPNTYKVLRPGLYAKARILYQIEKNALVIPQRCIMEIQGQYSVFVVNKDNIVEMRSVNVGAKIGDYWLIRSGLEPNEYVVIDAIQKVKNGLVVNPQVTTFESKTKAL